MNKFIFALIVFLSIKNLAQSSEIDLSSYHGLRGRLLVMNNGGIYTNVKEYTIIRESH